jgi:hypothetical protein
MKSDTIFISIASYRDGQLTATVQDAINKAKYPDRLRFGIVEQREASKRLALSVNQKKTMRYLGVDPVDSRGACWARAVAMSMYCDEDWFFQIDSHMLFEQDWDQWFIEESSKCLKVSDKPIISSYPKGYTLEDGKPKFDYENGVKVNVILKNFDRASFNPSNYTLSFEGVFLSTKNSLLGFHVGAGCLFAPGKFVNEIPYDPQFYFDGEEQAIALRAYTHGWDIFHVPNMPIYHLYKKHNRDSHWEGDVDEGRGDNNWQALKQRAIKRLAQLVSGENIGIYSLGTKRSVSDYANFCGIDYTSATLSEKAFAGLGDKYWNNFDGQVFGDNK